MDNLCRSFSLKEKCDLVQSIKLLIKHGASCKTACRGVGIPPLYYHRWKKVMKKVDDIEKEDCFHAHNTMGTARKIHPRRVGLLMTTKEQLTSFVFNMNQIMTRKALHVVPTFQDRTAPAQEQVKCLLTMLQPIWLRSTSRKPKTTERMSSP